MSDKTGLELLREKFPENQIGKLPKPTKAQTDEIKANYKAGMRCDICGTWHHPKVVHLDYIGHAALTDRLLDCDPAWSWEPLAYDDRGLPAFDQSGGLWGKLTVCGITRIGYGNAEPSQYKDVGSREKEVIGDFLRNAAMRFGAGLELWHKGELHSSEEDGEKTKKKHQTQQEANYMVDHAVDECAAALRNAPDLEGLKRIWDGIPVYLHPKLENIKNIEKSRLMRKLVDNFGEPL